MNSKRTSLLIGNTAQAHRPRELKPLGGPKPHVGLKHPQLRMCSPATRGIWAYWLYAMHELDRSGQLTGSPAQLARLGYCTTDEVIAALAELESTGAADVKRQEDGVVTLINRRKRPGYGEAIAARRRVETQGRDADGALTKPVTPDEL